MTDRKPSLPPSAVVWCVRLANRPPHLARLVELCHSRWGRYYACPPSRVRSGVEYAVQRGWLVAPAAGKWAEIREPEGSRFMLEHDQTLLRGHDRVLQEATTGAMQAWRRAHPEASR